MMSFWREEKKNRWVACRESQRVRAKAPRFTTNKKEAALWSYRAAIQFEQKHQMVNRSGRGIKIELGAKKFVANKVRDCLSCQGYNRTWMYSYTCLLNCCNVSFWRKSTFRFLLDETRLEVADKQAPPQHRPILQGRKQGTLFIMMILG
jgi:hypothetical protein